MINEDENDDPRTFKIRYMLNKRSGALYRLSNRNRLTKRTGKCHQERWYGKRKQPWILVSSTEYDFDMKITNKDVIDITEEEAKEYMFLEQI